MRPTTALYVLIASTPLALADIAFTAPAAGASLPAGTAITVTWKDSGDAPALADLASYKLFLYSGSNTAPLPLYPIVAAGVFSTGNSVKATIPVGTGGTGANAYFLGIESTATAGGTVTNFSNRFTLTGMTGTFNADVIASLKAVTGSTGPATINNVAGAAPAAGSAAAGAWGIPYNKQEGLTRYAPMQPIPGTKITATNTKALWPTSSVSLATTMLPIPSIVTTLTQPQTFSAASHQNTAAPQSQPMDDMEKYLNRWKD